MHKSYKNIIFGEGASETAKAHLKKRIKECQI